MITCFFRCWHVPFPQVIDTKVVSLRKVLINKVGKLEPHTRTESSCKGGNSVLPNLDTATCKGPLILPTPLSSLKGEIARVQVCLGHVSAETEAIPCLEGLKENWNQKPISHQVLLCYLRFSLYTNTDHCRYTQHIFLATLWEILFWLNLSL